VQYDVDIGGHRRRVNVQRSDESGWSAVVDGRERPIDAFRVSAHSWSLIVGTASYAVTVVPGAAPGQLVVTVDGVPVVAGLNGRRRWGQGEEGKVPGGPERMTAPMPGKVVRLLVKAGDAVRAHQPLVVIEAMKMDNESRASHAGVVDALLVREGESVDAGAGLAVVVSA
jgi:biotin carboxyl carrier protein